MVTGLLELLLVGCCNRVTVLLKYFEWTSGNDSLRGVVFCSSFEEVCGDLPFSSSSCTDLY